MLVSVVVVTYNSAEFVIEALNSIKAQTYQHIELIISDDASKDNTVELCDNWVKENNQRFSGCYLLTVEKNTGTSANYNRGWRKARGEWIKGLDGDDRLLPNCIKDNVDYITQHPNVELIFSKTYSFSREGLYTFDYKWNWGGELFRRLTEREFEAASYYWCLFCSPTVIISKKCFEEMGGYDETFKFIEDWPMWMKMMNEKRNIHFLNKITAEYRISTSSVSQGLGMRNPEYERCQNLVDLKARDYLKHMSIWSQIYYYTRERKENGSKFWSILHLLQYVNPFYHFNMRVLKKCEQIKNDYKSECENE